MIKMISTKVRRHSMPLAHVVDYPTPTKRRAVHTDRHAHSLTPALARGVCVCVSDDVLGKTLMPAFTSPSSKSQHCMHSRVQR